MNTFLTFFQKEGQVSCLSEVTKKLMITADINDRQHSVPWPHGATGLSQGEQCHLLNQNNHFTQSFCGILFVWGSLVLLSFSCF